MKKLLDADEIPLAVGMVVYHDSLTFAGEITAIDLIKGQVQVAGMDGWWNPHRLISTPIDFGADR